jgi:hypothetical protein
MSITLFCNAFKFIYFNFFFSISFDYWNYYSVIWWLFLELDYCSNISFYWVYFQLLYNKGIWLLKKIFLSNYDVLFGESIIFNICDTLNFLFSFILYIRLSGKFKELTFII